MTEGTFTQEAAQYNGFSAECVGLRASALTDLPRGYQAVEFARTELETETTEGGTKIRVTNVAVHFTCTLKDGKKKPLICYLPPEGQYKRFEINQKGGWICAFYALPGDEKYLTEEKR